jgi:hypothetical protein
MPDSEACRDPDYLQNRTRLFAWKWMTWEFFKSFIVDTFVHVGCFCVKTAKEGCFDAQWPPDFEDATTLTFSRSHWPALNFVKCRIPIKLLRAPRTQDKIQFPRSLLWTTSITVEWADPEVLEVVREGRRQAFFEKSLEAVQLFNHNRRFGRWPTLDFALCCHRCWLRSLDFVRYDGEGPIVGTERWGLELCGTG